MSPTVTQEAPPAVRRRQPVRRWPLVRSLARIEGRHLLRSPLVLGGFAFGFLAAFGTGVWVRELRSASADSAFICLLLAAATLVAANLAVLRARRHRTEELLGTTPSPPSVRTGAHLLSVLGPALLGVVMVAAALANDVFRREAYGRPDLAELAVGPLLVVGAGALGVLLARWAPSALVAPVMCLAIGAFELLMNSPPLVDQGWRWLAFWVQAGDLELLPARPARWHVGYLAGLVGLAAVGALARHGVRGPVGLGGAVMLAVTAVAGIAQVRTVPAQTWADRNAMLADPGSVQVCEQREAVRYCAFPLRRPLVARWAEAVTGVRAHVPADAWPRDMAVTERMTAGDLQYTPEQIRRVLPDLPPRGTPLPDDGDIHPGSNWTLNGATALSVGLGVASRVVHLPLAPPAPGTLCDAAGQGRAVVALWLGAQAGSRARDFLREASAPDLVSLEGRSYLVPMEATVQQAAAWGITEVRHARALLARPDRDVAADLARHWDRVTDPATTTAEVASLLGLPERPATATSARTTELRLGPPCGAAA